MKNPKRSGPAAGNAARQTAKPITGITILLLLAFSARAISPVQKVQRCLDSMDQFFLKIAGKGQVITAKAEDPDSYWVGASNGLWIISKHTFKARHLVQGSALPSNHITSICVTPDENVYVSTDKGILRFDGYSYLLLNTENTLLPSNDITSIACDKDGNLWIGTKDKGLVMMYKNWSRTFNVHNSVLTDNSVKGISRTLDGTILVELSNKAIVKIGQSGMQLVDHDSATATVIGKKN